MSEGFIFVISFPPMMLKSLAESTKQEKHD